jgi:GNAT superfamily N-acetyltransferase
MSSRFFLGLTTSRSREMRKPMSDIRQCRPDERATMAVIVNAAAEAYRGVIPADCWHEPYMTESELAKEIAAGVVFWGCERDSKLVGVMGIQSVKDVELIRHAYVLPAYQQHGIGRELLTHLLSLATRRMLVGTWADATWAIRFYQKNGFALAAGERKNELLETYWNITPRQSEVSVVLERAES